MFKWTAYDPLVEQEIDKGRIPPESVLRAFGEYPWGAMLAKMEAAKEEEIHFPPAVSFTNLDDAHSLEIVIVPDETDVLFNLYYDETAGDSYRFDLMDQTLEVTTDILAEFVDGDYARVRAQFVDSDQPSSQEPKPWWKFW